MGSVSSGICFQLEKNQLTQNMVRAVLYVSRAMHVLFSVVSG